MKSHHFAILPMAMFGMGHVWDVNFLLRETLNFLLSVITKVL